MRAFILKALSPSNLPTLHWFCILMGKNMKGSRPPFSLIFPRLALSSGFFHTLSIPGAVGSGFREQEFFLDLPHGNY
jgi:hypothetical protein